MLKRTAGFVAAIAAVGGLHSIYTRAVAQTPASAVTIEQVNRWEAELSNWGRWGKDDERGALNLVTSKKSVEAARLVKDGVTVSLARFADLDKAADNFNFGETKHTMVSRDPNTGRVRGALDAISFGIHDGTNSHLDALCHYALPRDGKQLVFNGHPQDLDEKGCKANGIDRMGPGIVTRGILVDLPLLKGVPYLEPGTAIYVSDLEAWEKYAGVKISSGDALFIRTGRWARRAKLGAWNAGREAAGLHATAMPWIKQHDIALLGSDGVNDVQPSGVVGTGEAANRPVHTLAIAVLGVPLVDNGYFEDVAREAAARKRWEFLTTVQFTRIPGGTATTFNALATF
ncbi:MAG TPA: cyclase family protein [Bryobacteraceae bacterium]|nr:cyclase family protein [Bryobacteraceae bacterium]